MALLKRVVGAIRARWPNVTLEVRADSGFASPALYAWCEAEGVGCTIGVATNVRLTGIAADLPSQAETTYATTGEKVRLIGEVTYRTETWPTERRVIVKAERLAKGLYTRFVVTSRGDAASDVYTFSTQRGDCENGVKDLKRGCLADRLSCHRFWANQFRLLLHAAAYWLLDTLRHWLMAVKVTRMTPVPAGTEAQGLV